MFLPSSFSEIVPEQEQKVKMETVFDSSNPELYFKLGDKDREHWQLTKQSIESAYRRRK